MEAENKFKEWPKDWPLYKQDCFGSWEKCCDMLVGPCQCGAWHDEGEFVYDPETQTLSRYGKPVPCLHTRADHQPSVIDKQCG